MTKYTNEKKEHALSQMSAPHNRPVAGQNRTGATERATDKKRVRELERDLRRKEKALAETAALMVLSRKYEALWTDGEDA